MKKLFFILFISLLLSSMAYALELDIGYIKQIPMSENFGDFDGIKVSISPDDSAFYIWLSGEHGRLTLASQQFTYVDLIGAGIGIKKQFKNIQLFVDAGWFEPFSNYNNKTFTHGDEGHDRLWLYLNEKYSYISGMQNFDYYKMSISGNFGGTFGIQYFYRINKYIKIYGVGGYRILSLPMMVEGWWEGNPNGWNRFENQNLSGPFIGIGFSF